MEALEEIPHHSGGIYNYFEGATILNLVINGNMNKHSTVINGNVSGDVISDGGTKHETNYDKDK